MPCAKQSHRIYKLYVTETCPEGEVKIVLYVMEYSTHREFRIEPGRQIVLLVQMVYELFNVTIYTFVYSNDDN